MGALDIVLDMLVDRWNVGRLSSMMELGGRSSDRMRRECKAGCGQSISGSSRSVSVMSAAIDRDSAGSSAAEAMSVVLVSVNSVIADRGDRGIRFSEMLLSIFLWRRVLGKRIERMLFRRLALGGSGVVSSVLSGAVSGCMVSSDGKEFHIAGIASWDALRRRAVSGRGTLA